MAFIASTILPARAENDPQKYAVMVSATVTTSPASIRLTWVGDDLATSYTISRKAKTATSWSTVANLAGSATTWADSNVSVGSAWEYALIKNTSAGYVGSGYIYAGVNFPLVDTRGKVILIVDNTYASQLTAELTRLQQDLVGDGWTVVRRDVSRTTSPPNVKSIIVSEYNADPANVRAVFLFGHVAVPYSGDFNPDGHPDHRGAWAADTYYGDINGTWTDSSVNNGGAEQPRNRNFPGDGKFDQSNIPSDIDLEVGRVDLYNMTCYSNKTPSRNELDLLRQYLNKDNNFRHGRLNVQRRGIVCDNFGERNGEAFASSGWRNFAPMFHPSGLSRALYGQFFSTLNNNSYLFAYGTGGGSFYTCDGVGGSDDFANGNIQSVFTFFLGSYFGDWDNESNFLRAPLGGTTYTLTSAWAGRPHWFVHHMGLGETIGYGAKVSQNNGSGGLYRGQNVGSRQVHVSLLGDPTLRLHPVLPVSNVQASGVGGTASITWAPSTDTAIVGYHVYRGSSATGPFTRLTTAPVAASSFTDVASPAGSIYMVRAIKLETSGSGTYYNASQGVFSTGGGVTPTAPAAPSNFVATGVSTSQVQLGWADNSSNEAGFRIERKTGSGGTYATISTTSANAVGYADSGLAAGTQYFYRLTAVNATGASSSIEASASTPSAGTVNASAAFVATDTSTAGTWRGAYGSEGSYIATDSPSLPGYVQVTPAGASTWTWQSSTTDTRCLQRVSGVDRLAATWYSATSFTMDLRFTDSQSHRVALYFLDWDRVGRTQTVEMLDATSGAVLDTRTLSAFGEGKYFVWDLRGNVRVRLTNTGANNALLNGIFFGPAPAGPPTNITDTTSGSLAGNNYNLRITGQAGQTFQIRATSDLVTWSAVSTVTLTGTTYDYVDTARTSTTRRFYKAVPQ